MAALALLVASACGDDVDGSAEREDRDKPADAATSPEVSVLAPTRTDAWVVAANSATDGGGEVSGTEAAAVAPSYDCPSVPTAYVFDYADPYTGVLGAETALREAGFEVKPLPLDQSPALLRGLIVFGSFASASPDYAVYMQKYAADLYGFVDRANVLVQLTQADQTEIAPPFLPTTLVARRDDLDLGQLHVMNPDSPLLSGVRVQGSLLAWQGGNVGWETFSTHAGFEVVLAQDASAKRAALMEGAYGQGRLILVALALDKVPATVAEAYAFRKAFFANLVPHVVGVCQRKTSAIRITPTTPSATFAADSYMFAVLPDTQVYSLVYPGLLSVQTAWIATQSRARRIVYALQLGDITNNNSPGEWRHAADAFSLLDGVVPYAVVPGNHDYGPSGDASTRDTLMNQYLSYARIAAMPTFGGAYESGRLDNTYHLFSVGKRHFILLALEWGPRDEVIQWADALMGNNPDRWGILITHAYLNNNDRRFDSTDAAHPQDFDPHFYATPGGVNDGEELWRKLVRKHRFIMVLSGHTLGDGTGYLASKTDLDVTCHQMLSNYQFRNLGGEGYMRLIEFLADDRTVRVYTYSPLHDSFLADPDQSFDFSLDWPAPS